ncbi:MAG: hypothetical protein ACYCZN_02135 [Candidatus Dormibacteria bacterium]
MAIAKLPHAKVGKLVTAEVIANPYRAMKSLHWPARIMVVTYDGTFSVPTPCPSGKAKCAPVTFHSATAVLNPTSDAILETVEPGWPAKGSAGGSRTGPTTATKGGK